MEFERDEAKCAANPVLRGLPFSEAARMNWTAAEVREDTRRDYGERRVQAVAPIDGVPHACVYTLRGGRRRIVSLGRAKARERRRYER